MKGGKSEGAGALLISLESQCTRAWLAREAGSRAGWAGVIEIHNQQNEFKGTDCFSQGSV